MTTLDRLMTERGTKQRILVEKLDVQQKRITGLRNGRYEPTLREALLLSEFFGVRVEEFTTSATEATKS